MKKVAILQSNYIPWKGYFDIISYVDEFVIFDDVQYTKNDWRNRNQIKIQNGLKWLSIPVHYSYKGIDTQNINETEVKNFDWTIDHLNNIKQAYKKSPYYNEILNIIEPIYLGKLPTNLSKINKIFIDLVCDYLGINTRITNSCDYSKSNDKTIRLLDICIQLGATHYVSGPAAKSYLDESLFLNKGIQVEWFDYKGYTEYPQLHGDFVHNVSIIDLLFNTGKESKKYMLFTDFNLLRG